MPAGRSAVVVVNYGSHRLLDEHLADVGQRLPEFDVVVVDNYSGPAERAAIRRLATDRRWHLLTPSGNEGFGSGVNLGVAHAIGLGCDAFVLVNPDVEIAPATLSALADRVRANPERLVSPRLLLPGGDVWFAGGQIDLTTGLTTSRPDERQRGRERWLSGACLAIHHEMWERLGGFDTDYFMYWEDVDLSQRCLALGGDLRVEHDLHAVHSVGATQEPTRSAERDPTSTRWARSGLYYQYNCRNRLLFACRNVPPATRWRWLLATPRSCWLVIRRTPAHDLVRRPSLIARALAGAAVGAWWLIGSIVTDGRR